MLALGKEIRGSNNQSFTKHRKLFKGNVLARRKAKDELVREDLGRLVLPDIHNSRGSDDSCCPKYKNKNSKGTIRKGYTFDPCNIKVDKSILASLDEDGVGQLLSFKSLGHTKERNLHTDKYWNPGSSEQMQRNKMKVSCGDDHSGLNDSLANDTVNKKHKNNKYSQVNVCGSTRRGNFPKVLSHIDLPSKLIVRKSEVVDTRAKMCTQSLNSLCIDLAMYKDAVSRGLKREDKLDRTRTPGLLLNVVNRKNKYLYNAVDDSRRSRTRENNSKSSATRGGSV